MTNSVLFRINPYIFRPNKQKISSTHSVIIIFSTNSVIQKGEEEKKTICIFDQRSCFQDKASPIGQTPSY